jgi:hypothetical protein
MTLFWSLDQSHLESRRYLSSKKVAMGVIRIETVMFPNSKLATGGASRVKTQPDYVFFPRKKVNTHDKTQAWLPIQARPCKRGGSPISSSTKTRTAQIINVQV